MSNEKAKGGLVAPSAVAPPFPESYQQALEMKRALEEQRRALNLALSACALHQLSELIARCPVIQELAIYWDSDTNGSDGFMRVKGISGAYYLSSEILYGKLAAERKAQDGKGDNYTESKDPRRLAQQADCAHLALSELREAHQMLNAVALSLLIDEEQERVDWSRAAHGTPNAIELARVFGLKQLAVAMELAGIERAVGTAPTPRSKPRSI